MTNALNSLYGRGNAARVAALAGAGEREQQILTPQPVVDALARLWPEGIALDPCAAPGQLVVAERYYYVPPRAEQRIGGKGRKAQVVIRYRAEGGDTDGKALPWTPRTYINPPFNDLLAWLGKAAKETLGGLDEWCMLAPVRTHRQWFRDAMKHVEVVWLNADFKFVGYDQAFPAPLCILYRGSRDAGKAFAGIGEAIQPAPCSACALRNERDTLYAGIP